MRKNFQNCQCEKLDILNNYLVRKFLYTYMLKLKRKCLTSWKKGREIPQGPNMSENKNPQ